MDMLFQVSISVANTGGELPSVRVSRKLQRSMAMETELQNKPQFTISLIVIFHQVHSAYVCPKYSRKCLRMCVCYHF